MSVRIVRRPAGAGEGALIASGVDARFARLFASRGVIEAADLETGLGALPSFASLRDIDRATSRLAHAIDTGERVLVVADYDADGATGCALGVRGLRAFGANVDFLVPNRFTDGYGLTPEIVEQAKAFAPGLIVTVDNGIGSHDGILVAAAAGIDVLVTDHHLPGATLPSPAIIVDPNQPGCEFPSRHIAGVGVMFYVLAALRARLRDLAVLPPDAPSPATWLDLVALGTVADVVRLDRVNRILVEQGLRRLRAGRGTPGVEALFRVAGRDPCRASATDLGFVAGPRLNAAGRMADMSIGIRCLLADDATQANALAAELDRFNRERRGVEARMQDEAVTALDLAAFDAGDSESCSICLYRQDWHPGVVGIVASRLKERLHRPAIVFARGPDGELKGSGRSIAGLHLRDALDLVAKREPGLLRRFGGHAFAAGMSIAAADLDRFAGAFEAVAREHLDAAALRRVIESDGPLEPGALTLDFARELGRQVWGQGFPAPAFDERFEVLSQRIVAGAHTRLTLARGRERFDAVRFGATDPLPGAIRAVFRPEVDRYQGLESVQLVLLYWTPP